jgi:hypothetical protein
MYSHYGQVSVDFNMLYGEGYINVERYANGKAAGWVVKNLPVTSGSVLPGYSTMFDLGASGYQATFSAYVDFSPTALANDTSLKGQAALTYQLGQAEYPLSAPGPAGPLDCPKIGVCITGTSSGDTFTWKITNPNGVAVSGVDLTGSGGYDYEFNNEIPAGWSFEGSPKNGQWYFAGPAVTTDFTIKFVAGGATSAEGGKALTSGYHVGTAKLIPFVYGSTPWVPTLTR